jgi:MoaA/NifB/PqqE/SkfB family radical SAM enzyme
MTFTRKLKPHEFNVWRNQRPQLGQLDIELTERCNNNCIHCCINLPAHDAAARAREMTTAQVQDILQQAADLGCLQVRFTGGEPLLRPDFEELYLFARRLGMKVLVFTNARLITPRLADLFARIPPLMPIEVTVYGMRAASYEAVTRAPGSFAQFWRGVHLLLERRVPFIVKQALLPPNRAEIAEFEAWAKMIPWMHKRPSYSMNFDLRNRRDDGAKNAEVAGLRLSPEETVAMLARDASRYRKEMAEFASKFMGPPGDKLFNCGAGHGMCVDAYGRAQPCMGVRAPELTVALGDGSSCHCEEAVCADEAILNSQGGDCFVANTAPRNDTSLSLVNALAQFAALRELRATNPDYLARCARCFLKGLCEQCPAKSWAEHGTHDTPVEYLCQVAHAQARYLGLLGADERAWEIERTVSRERVARFVEDS